MVTAVLPTCLVNVMTPPHPASTGDRIIEPLIALARCAKSQRILVAGSKSIELTFELQRRGYARLENGCKIDPKSTICAARVRSGVRNTPRSPPDGREESPLSGHRQVDPLRHCRKAMTPKFSYAAAAENHERGADHETRKQNGRAIIRERMALPREQRQTAEQAAVFGLKVAEKHEFRRSGDPVEESLPGCAPHR
jgi:hypothetical protein